MAPNNRVWTISALVILLSGCEYRGDGGSGGGAGSAGTGGGGYAGSIGGIGGDPCGNGTIDPGEQCDGVNLRGFGCWDLGFPTGVLGCSDACAFDTSACDPRPECGDNVRAGLEACDGTDLGGWDCQTAGYGDGVLNCFPPGNPDDCRFDTSECTGSGSDCGNSQLEGIEQCDGTELGGIGCTDLGLGYTGGSLACHSDCRFDDSACEGSPPLCGDGLIEGAEDCEGDDLGGATCASVGFYTGNLGCDVVSCFFDLSRCHWCGNGELDEGEECDGSNHDNTTCLDLGYEDGALYCDMFCRFYTQGCRGGECLLEEAGLSRCAGDVLEICSAGGIWTIEEDCALEGEICITLGSNESICLGNL